MYDTILTRSSFTTVLSVDSGGVRVRTTLGLWVIERLRGSRIHVQWLIATGLTIAFAADLLFTPTLTVALWRSRAGHQGCVILASGIAMLLTLVLLFQK